MTDQPESQKPDSSNSVSNVSGGVNANAEQIHVGGDVVGRDKTVSAGTYIEHATFLTTLSTAPAKPKVYQNLPGGSYVLVGRDSTIDTLQGYLSEQGYSPLVIVGGPGMGKSAVAKVVAKRCLNKGDFEACVWWSAHYEPRPLTELLDQISRVLPRNVDDGDPADRNVDGIYRLLRHQRCLLVIAKITQTDHGEIINFLKGVPSTTSVLIATVSRLPYGKHVHLDPLAEPAAIQLLRARIDMMGDHPWRNATNAQLMPLVVKSSGSPVALALAAGLGNLNTPLDSIVEDLKSGHGDFRVLCANLYDRLEEAAQRALNLICISRESIASDALVQILGTDRKIVEPRILRELRNMGLIIERGLDWASMRFEPASRLVREYVAAISADHPEEDRRLREAEAAYYFEASQRNGFENWAGHDWLEQNVSELLAVLDWYDETQQWSQLVKMFNALYYFMGVRGYWQQRLDYSKRAIQAADQCEDRHSAALLRVRVLGRTETQMGRLAEAEQDLQTGLKVLLELQDHSCAASALRYLGTIERRRHNYAQAEAYYQEALSHAEQAPDRDRLVAGIQVSKSMLYQKTEHYADSEQQLRAARESFQRLNHQSKVAEVLSRLGDVLLLQQRPEEAEALYRESEKHLAGVNRAKTRAYNYIGLAQVAQLRGQVEQAQAYAQRARMLFGNLGLANEANEIAILRQLATTS